MQLSSGVSLVVNAKGILPAVTLRVVLPYGHDVAVVEE